MPEKFDDYPDIKRAILLPNEKGRSDFLDFFGRSSRDTPCECETSLEPNLAQVLYLLHSDELQRKIAAYRQVQHDTTNQLYGISTALLLRDDRMLEAALRQLNQFGYDMDRMAFVAESEAKVLGEVRQEYGRFASEVTRVADLARSGRTDEARAIQLERIVPSGERLERLTPAEVKVPGVTLDVPNVTSRPEVVASGRGPIGEVVSVRDGGSELGSTKVGPGGYWKLPVTLADMAYHTRCVARGNRNAWLLADLPFASYHEGEAQALASAAALMRAGAHMVKLECAAWAAPTSPRSPSST